jgi:hypothetical protein
MQHFCNTRSHYGNQLRKIVRHFNKWNRICHLHNTDFVTALQSLHIFKGEAL